MKVKIYVKTKSIFSFFASDPLIIEAKFHFSDIQKLSSVTKVSQYKEEGGSKHHFCYTPGLLDKIY